MNKTTGSEYAAVVLLDYIRNHVQSPELYLPEYLNRELGIADIYGTVHGLTRRKLLEKGDDGVLVLTEKGKELLEEKEDYVLFFRQAIPYVSVEEYEEQKMAMDPGASFEAVLITLLLRQIRMRKSADDFEAVKNLHMDIAGLYERGQYTAQAMMHCLTALYYETSGLEYYDRFLNFIRKKSTAKELERLYSYACIDPQMIAGVKRLQDNYSEDMVDVIFEKNPISINLCEKENFKSLIDDIINDTFVNRDWQKFFWRTYKELISVASQY